MTAPSRAAVVYVSGHGYGHSVRTGLVVEQLHRLAPDLAIQVRSTTPPWLFPANVQHLHRQVDVGLLQADSLTPRFEETVAAALEFERSRPRLVAMEVAELAAVRLAFVLGDIPPLAFDVAHELGVPGVALGNFSWDWIYASLGQERDDVAELVASVRASHARADLLMRLPMFGDLSSFPHHEDIPLIARISEVDRSATRRRLGIPDDRPVVLLSFGGFELERLELHRLGRMVEYSFVTTLPVEGLVPTNVICCPRAGAGYHHLLAACDVAVMKPGFSTVADCVANRVPMVYTRRPGYVEDEVLVRAMHELGPAIEIPHDALLAGELAPWIELALADRTRWKPVPLDGAQVAARRILQVAGLSSLDG